MVVEDSAFIRKLTRGLLVSIGVGHILEATDGTAALQTMRSFQPDIILLDWEMPNLSGPQFIRHLQERSFFPNVAARVIFLTAHADRRRVIFAKSIGIGGFVTKPMSANMIRQHIFSILGKDKTIGQQGAERYSDSVMLID
jgi:two-component system chemotaxis response regulator CheY